MDLGLKSSHLPNSSKPSETTFFELKQLPLAEHVLLDLSKKIINSEEADFNRRMSEECRILIDAIHSKILGKKENAAWG